MNLKNGERWDGNSISKQERDTILNTIRGKKYKSFLEIGTYMGFVPFSLYNEIVENQKGLIESVDYLPSAEDELVYPFLLEVSKTWSLDNMKKRYNSNKKFIKDNNLKNIYLYIIGSDEYFKKNKKTFDCILLHGSHMTEQVRRDLDSASKCLNSNGTIFLHPIKGHEFSPSDVLGVYHSFNKNGFTKKILKQDYRGFGIFARKY